MPRRMYNTIPIICFRVQYTDDDGKSVFNRLRVPRFLRFVVDFFSFGVAKTTAIEKRRIVAILGVIIYYNTRHPNTCFDIV